jgi:N-acetyl-1-D-myo-inositol-2-amino-2-deoxy-alpha-D-glucopyranoside deacetylase
VKKLLVIFAHPDDESFGPVGGTLAKYAREGVAVHYICATRGEAGMVDDALLHHSSIAALRTRELQQAARVLGLKDVRFLNYRDSGMLGSPDNQHRGSLFAAPVEEVARRIAGYMQAINPDVIVTHDQYGWYGHPDHIKCYDATLRAYELLYGIQPDVVDTPRLYVSSFPKGLVKLAVRVMPILGRNPRQLGQNGDIDLVEIASWDVPLTTRINVKQYLPTKERAAACHVSQQQLDRSTNPLLHALFERAHAVETFSRLYPFYQDGEPVETDLFGDDSRQRFWRIGLPRIAA